MKQEWFESNDFVKTTSKNNPEEQAQEVADKAEETIANLDTPIEKNTQVEEEVSQAEVELESQQEEKIEAPEDSEARTEIEEKKALEQNRVIALEKKGTKFVVPDKVYRKVMVVTGRNEVDPNAPKNYMSQDDFRKDFDNKVKAVRGGSMVVRKQNF